MNLYKDKEYDNEDLEGFEGFVEDFLALAFKKRLVTENDEGYIVNMKIKDYLTIQDKLHTISDNHIVRIMEDDNSKCKVWIMKAKTELKQLIQKVNLALLMFQFMPDDKKAK